MYNLGHEVDDFAYFFARLFGLFFKKVKMGNRIRDLCYAKRSTINISGGPTEKYFEKNLFTL